MKTAIYIVPVILTVLLIGCGTIIHGTTQEIGITTNPTGATVVIDGANLGSTPLTQELSRKNQHTFQLSLDGYQPYDMIINRRVSGWVWGNIVFGGLIGLAVDAGTGGMYRLDPEQINAQMNASIGSKVNAKNGLIYITVVLEPNPEWEPIGALIKVD